MYFIAIVLPGELNKKIKRWKEYMNEKYSCNVSLRSPAHITLLPPCWLHEENEGQLIKDMDSFCKTEQPFNVATHNFGAFKPKTLFIDIADNNNLAGLKKRVDEFFSTTQHQFKFDTRPFHPHITIATRDLHKKDFHEAWAFFESKKFMEEWKVTGLSLLRHNSVNWDIVHTSPFSTNDPD
jgi:2'-5' RNA ligase